MVWTEVSLRGLLNLLREIALACPTSEMTWHLYSSAMHVLNLGTVPRVFFCASEHLLFVPETLLSKRTSVAQFICTEMGLSSRLGESRDPLENIKELRLLLGKYSYHVPNIEGNGFTLTFDFEMQAENNRWAMSADLYLIELLQERLKLCKRAAAWHIRSMTALAVWRMCHLCTWTKVYWTTRQSFIWKMAT